MFQSTGHASGSGLSQGRTIEENTPYLNKEISTSPATIDKRQIETDVNIERTGVRAGQNLNEQSRADGTDSNLFSQNSSHPINQTSAKQANNGCVYADTLPPNSDAYPAQIGTL